MSDSYSPASPLRFLAISGSLRGASSNTTLLRAMLALAPEGVEMELFGGLGDLPHYNPDLDNENPPAVVTDWRNRLKAADGVLICSPEYAHGVPGVMKNGLDWIVSSGEFIGKPVALINAKPQATIAQASLHETLTVMMARIDPAASIAISLGTNKIDEATILSNEAMVAILREAIQALVNAVANAES